MRQFRSFIWKSASLGVLLLTAFASGAACSSRDDAPRTPARVLAKNVVLATAKFVGIKSANAASDAPVDPNLVVRAENVVYERSGRADLAAADVQVALESLAVNLQTVLPGTWSIANVGDDGSESTGKIRFDPDLSFQLLEGEMRAIELPKNAIDGAKPRSVKFPSPRLPQFNYSAFTMGAASDSLGRSVIPMVVDARPDRIVLIGFRTNASGVSILTRDPQP
jgi:hypothetical protein